MEQQTKIKTPRRRKTAFKKRARGFLIGSMGLEYLPTFTIKINKIEVNIPYMDPMALFPAFFRILELRVCWGYSFYVEANNKVY